MLKVEMLASKAMSPFPKAEGEVKNPGILNRTWRLLAACLLGGLCTAGARPNGSAITPEPSAVGPLSDPARIEFEGNRSFSPNQLRNSLMFHERFQEAAHPSAPLDGLLDTIRDEILSGYQRNGFPDAQIRVGLMPDGDHLGVKIKEGPRFLCGGVTVTGARKSMARLIAFCLTNPPPDADTEESLYWQPEQPAHFDPSACASMENVVRESLAKRGWFFPKMALSVERTPGNPQAHLVVAVSSLGPPGKIMELEIQGNHKNSAPAMLRFLGLKRGATITSDKIAAAQKKLWNSGRVLESTIEPRMLAQSEDQSRGVRLVVRVQEYAAAPRIDESLTVEQRALLRLCRRLSNFANCAEDAVVTFDIDEQPLAGYVGKMILSPRGGALVKVRARENSPVEGGYTLVFRPGAFGLYPPEHRAKFVLEQAGLTLTPSINISVTPNPPGSEDPFSLTVFLGSNWQSNDSPTNAPADGPVLQLNLSPAAFLYLGAATNRVCSVRNGLLTVTDSSGLLRADSRTGRLIDFSYRRGGGSVNVQFQAGAFTEAVRQLDTDAGGHDNAFDAGQPTASLVGFLMRELAFSYLSRQAMTNGPAAKLDPRVVQVIDRLLSTRVFAALDQARSGVQPGEEYFWIPKDDADRQLSQQGYNIWLSCLLERFGRGWLPADSWAWRLMLDSAELLNRQTMNALSDLNALNHSEKVGPVGCFAAAYVASRFNLPIYRDFASKGLQMEGAFPIDYSLLLTGDSGFALCFAQWAATLRQLPAGDVEALARTLPGQEGSLFTQAYRAVRSAPNQSLWSSLGPVLDEYWRKVLGPEFQAGFECTLAHH